MLVQCQLSLFLNIPFYRGIDLKVVIYGFIHTLMCNLHFRLITLKGWEIILFHTDGLLSVFLLKLLDGINVSFIRIYNEVLCFWTMFNEPAWV